MKFTYAIDETCEIRLLELSDAEDWYNLIIQDKEHIHPWFGWLDTFKTVEDARQFISTAQNQYVNLTGMKAGLWINKQLVGGISYQEILWNNATASLGAWVSQSYEGKGYITKALLHLTEYAFGTLNLNRVEAITGVDNLRGRALMKRMGFQEEGILRHSLKLRDQYFDEVVYGALQKEWKRPEGL